MDDIKQLRRWKEEALPILMAWDDVYEVLGGGLLGESKAKAALREAKRLKAINADLLAALEAIHIRAHAEAKGNEGAWHDISEFARRAIAKVKA